MTPRTTIFLIFLTSEVLKMRMSQEKNIKYKIENGKGVKHRSHVEPLKPSDPHLPIALGLTISCIEKNMEIAFFFLDTEDWASSVSNQPPPKKK